ncbi:MAG: molybdopterin-dependent oxidoreductase [Anaerolineaceae bacterium]|nr:molybdopterin-dependent oxidoreductase [Anaerolineaceae bacterium]
MVNVRRKQNNNLKRIRISTLSGRINPVIILATLLPVITIVFCACSPTPASFEIFSSPTIHPGDPLPLPQEEIILEVSGDISTTNQGEKLVFDIKTLESLGLIQYSVMDPWFNAENLYTGVQLSVLLDIAGISADATHLNFTAMDDYQISIPVEDAYKWPVLLATRVNGEYISISDAGPTRIIYPYETFPEIDITTKRNLWIWNIKTLEIE